MAMKLIRIKNYNAGAIILEAVVAIIVIGIAFSVLFDVATLSIKTSSTIQQNEQANFLLKEEMEAVRSYRDGTTWTSTTNPIGLGKVNTGGANPYYFTLSSNAWSMTPGTETTGIFTRKVIFDQVYRDASNNIVNSGGTLDTNTIKATVTVTGPQKTLSLVTYFTNWK